MPESRQDPPPKIGRRASAPPPNYTWIILMWLLLCPMTSHSVAQVTQLGGQAHSFSRSWQRKGHPPLSLPSWGYKEPIVSVADPYPAGHSPKP